MNRGEVPERDWLNANLMGNYWILDLWNMCTILYTILYTTFRILTIISWSEYRARVSGIQNVLYSPKQLLKWKSKYSEDLNYGHPNTGNVWKPKLYYSFYNLVASDGLYWVILCCYPIHVYRSVCFKTQSRQPRLIQNFQCTSIFALWSFDVPSWNLY